MKVGTDGVLLGAWAPTEGGNMLDIGTGSGLIALMLAQRCPEAHIDAIDIDADAITQAQFNFAASPWSNRLHAHHISLQNFVKKRHSLFINHYSLIVSNPPYFIDSLKNPDQQRQTARHTDTLSYSELIQGAAQLLAPDGTFAVILPAEAFDLFTAEAAKVNLFPSHITHVYSKPGKPLKRILLAFQFPSPVTHNPSPITDSIYIESSTSPRSEEYARLTADFYL